MLQSGEKPADASPVPGLKDVFELRAQDERAWYRILHYKKVGNRIHVLHCFEKQSGKIEKRDIRTAESRLNVVRQRMEQEKLRERKEKRDGARDARKRT